ncbi:hypothetical protein NDU88_007993 [Pleurodeles waltl]|uniref:Uncharacterized protein n=1 Tax=Pleurodeles waltl TaxID=8319 RepID=A0AAV7VVD3_PLEWA|nr:hypothetical protein NDU88_007993 [Pleurodeles waltl]
MFRSDVPPLAGPRKLSVSRYPSHAAENGDWKKDPWIFRVLSARLKRILVAPKGQSSALMSLCLQQLVSGGKWEVGAVHLASPLPSIPPTPTQSMLFSGERRRGVGLHRSVRNAQRL